MEMRFAIAAAGATTGELRRIASERPDIAWFLVEAPTGPLGFLTRESALGTSGVPEKPVALANIARRRFLTVGADTPLHDAMARMGAADADAALVTDGSDGPADDRILGLLMKAKIADLAIGELAVFSE